MSVRERERVLSKEASQESEGVVVPPPYTCCWGRCYCWKCCVPCGEGLEVENLYRRYFLRLHQRSLAALLGILTLSASAVLLLNYFALYRPSGLQGALFGCLLVVYAGLALLSSARPVMAGGRPLMLGTAYCTAVSLLASVAVLSFEGTGPTSGAWAAALYTYLTYSLLPFRLYECLACGIMLSAVQLGCAVACHPEHPYLMKQASFVLLLTS